MTYTNWTKWYQTTRVTNALIIGNSLNTQHLCSGSIGLITAQTDGMLVDGAKFFNYDNSMYTLGDESHSFANPTRDFGARMVKLKRLQFTNSHRKVSWTLPFSGFWEIMDNSLTGTPGDYLAAYWPHLLNSQCTDETSTYNSIVCTGRKIRRIGFSNLAPFSIFNVLNVNIFRDDGSGNPPVGLLNYLNGSQSIQPLISHIAMQRGGRNHHEVGYAWNVPVVTNFTYRIFWGVSPVDWTSLYIEQDLFDDGEWVHLTLNFTDNREAFAVNRGVLPPGSNLSDPLFIDPTATLFKNDSFLSSDPSGTFKWNNCSGAKTFEILVNGIKGNDVQFGNISVSANRCSGTSCSRVNVTNTTNTTLPKTVKYWSDSLIWPNGFPGNGSYVEVPNTWHLYLDIDTPVLQEIEINGVLELISNKSVTLSAQWVFVRGGKLISGSADSPINKTIEHKIVLYGNPTDDSFAFNPAVEGGNKVIVVTGQLSMHGYPKVPFTQLEQNAYPGDQIIWVTGVDWDVGDQITISPSGFSPTEFENFTILEISGKIANYDQIKANMSVPQSNFSADADWVNSNSFRYYGKDKSYLDPNQQVDPASPIGISKIKLDRPVGFYHSGAGLRINNYWVDMRTEVALSSRNVKIMQNGNGWPGTVLVNDYLDELVTTGPVFRTGNVQLSNIEFDDCGQLDTNLACLRFQHSGANSSLVEKCLFKNAKTWSIYMDNAGNITFSNNLILNARWRGFVAVAISSVTISNNVIIGVSARGYNKVLDASAGFFICSAPDFVCTFIIANNKVLGSELAGYIMSAGECGNSQKVSSGNKVRSAFEGFIFTVNGNFTCVQVSNNIGHFTQEALGFKGWINEFQMTGLEFIENLAGMSMRTNRGNDGVIVKGSLSNSVFIGKTIHSLCQDCLSDLDCSQRVGYIFGISDLSIGVIQLTGKIMIPMSEQAAIANILGSHYLSSVQFMNYNENPKCSARNDFAMSSNPNAPDYELPQFLSKISFTNVNKNNRVYMCNPNPDWINPSDCVDWNCTGPLNSLVVDLDGSLVDGTGGFVLPNNPGIARNDICQLNSKMNAYLCQKNSSDPNYYMIMSWESRDADQETRTFSPINETSFGTSFVSKLGNFFRNDLAEFQDHMWDGFYTGHLRMSRFPGIVYSGVYYNITSRGTLPNNLMFVLQATQGRTEPIIVTLKYMDPAVVSLYIGGKLVEPLSWINGKIRECTLNDPHGCNRWFHEEHIIQFVLRNETEVHIKKSSAVQVNLELQLQLSDFFSNNGNIAFVDKFAVMLGIPSYRIRVVNIRQGSTVVDLYVLADQGIPANQQLGELNGVHNSIQDAVKNGSFEINTGYKVITFASVVQEIGNMANGTPTQGNPNTGSGNNGFGGNNEGSGDSAGGGSQGNNNQGDGKRNSEKFEVIADDWVLAIFGGIIFLLVVLSGLVVYTKNSNKNVILQDVRARFSGKVMNVNEISPEMAFSPEN